MVVVGGEGGFVDTLENDEIHDSDTSGVCVKQLVWAGPPPPPTHTCNPLASPRGVKFGLVLCLCRHHKHAISPDVSTMFLMFLIFLVF